MVRVKRGNVAKKHRTRVLKFAKGFKGAHSRLFRVANGQVMKALVYSYVGRKQRKRDFKKIWICRVNAAARLEGLESWRCSRGEHKTAPDDNERACCTAALAPR